jgi:hypothetical protein
MTMTFIIIRGRGGLSALSNHLEQRRNSAPGHLPPGADDGA